jgi:hypothetical protein
MRWVRHVARTGEMINTQITDVQPYILKGKEPLRNLCEDEMML